jgi:tetratricopeptide (TPR) repeat protein
MSDNFQFIERARLLLEQGRTGDAIKQVKNALEQDPDDDDALALMARCLYAQKDFNGGMDVLKRAIAIDPEHSYYYYLLAFGHYRKDENQLAISTLEQSISINPYFAESYGLLAYVYRDNKNFKAALAKANEGLAIDPENITCLNVRSIALNKLKMTDAAIETMQYALAQDPDNEFTHSTVAWNYLEKGKHNLAAKHFREALRIDPNYGNAKEGLKEALKSKIPPYKWLLRYSFWINNKGSKARWMIPIGLYLAVRISATVFEKNASTEMIGGAIVALYLLFVITSWLINPIANLFLYFHPDGKYALNETEKYTALTVVGALVSGLSCLVIGVVLPESINLSTGFLLAGAAFCFSAVPLGRIEYPLLFNGYGTQNKIWMILSGLGLITVPLAFLYLPAAMVTAGIFLVIFVINNWLGVFR